jgi:hypothetical protein
LEPAYATVQVTDEEGDSYGVYSPPAPLRGIELSVLRDEAGDLYRAIEEEGAEPESEEEREAFQNGPQHYFLWYACHVKGWTDAAPYRLTVEL